MLPRASYRAAQAAAAAAAAAAATLAPTADCEAPARPAVVVSAPVPVDVPDDVTAPPGTISSSWHVIGSEAAKAKAAAAAAAAFEQELAISTVLYEQLPASAVSDIVKVGATREAVVLATSKAIRRLKSMPEMASILKDAYESAEQDLQLGAELHKLVASDDDAFVDEPADEPAPTSRSSAGDDLWAWVRSFGRAVYESVSIVGGAIVSLFATDIADVGADSDKGPATPQAAFIGVLAVLATVGTIMAISSSSILIAKLVVPS